MRKAQVSLELGLALIGVFILLVGVLNVFIWVNQRMVQRQKDYETDRQLAGSSYTGQEVRVDESNTTKYPDLDIFR